jgi:hypothetical protein
VQSQFSVSKRLANSVDQHRRWRYTFNLIKQQARTRRNISLETTLIFMADVTTPEMVAHYEKCLDQYYSNFKLLFYDTTPQASAIEAVRGISDPRVAFFHKPGASEQMVLNEGLKIANTAFIMLYRFGPNGGAMDLHKLTDRLRGELPQITHSHMEPDGTVIVGRGRPKIVAPMRLYRTGSIS